MDNNKKYNIESFFVGELYLYTNFAYFTSRLYNPNNQDKIKQFQETDAINFQKEPLSRYISWDIGREYTGFLTIFYKQGNNYICLHDGNIYRLKGDTYIENLIPLNELLPKINSKLQPTITVDKALQLFNILFKQQIQDIELYNDNKQDISTFYIGDITLDEIIISDNGYSYPNLQSTLILNNQSLILKSIEDYNTIKTTYRCLFIEQEKELYNLNNHKFYNPNELYIDNQLPLNNYINNTYNHQTICIPKALKLFKNNI